MLAFDMKLQRSFISLAVSGGGAIEGALLMVVFGLGTLPGPIFGSVVLQKLSSLRPWLRPAVAGLVLIFGLSGLVLRAPSSEGAPSCHSSSK